MALTGAEVSLIMTYLRNCELAQGSVAAVCRSWFQTHRGCAWASMVLSAGAADDLIEDLALSEAHTTVERFLSAPRNMQEHASRSAQSLTLKICQLEEFLDHYEKWITLPFDRLKRLVLEGPNCSTHCSELLLRDDLDGLRFGLALSKFSLTVETLIIAAGISGSGKDSYDDILKSVVPIF